MSNKSNADQSTSHLCAVNNSSNARDVPHPQAKDHVHRNRMDRPPYSLAEPEKPFNAIYKGSCFCGGVEYGISREKPLGAKFCHCPTCQRLHGAPFQWAAILHKTDVHFTKGKDQLIYWHPSEKTQEYLLPCKVSCANCRTPIMDEGRNMLLLFPTLIQFHSLREKRKWYPTCALFSYYPHITYPVLNQRVDGYCRCHIFYSRRAMDVRDGLPKWEKHKEESALISETLDEDVPPTID